MLYLTEHLTVSKGFLVEKKKIVNSCADFMKVLKYSRKFNLFNLLGL